MATLLIGPTNRGAYPNNDEYNYARINAAQTAVLVAAGAGKVHSITVGVVGTLLRLFDVASGGTADDTTEMARFDVSVLTSQPMILDVVFTQGLTAILTGAGDVTVYFAGAKVASTRTFGA